MSSEKKMTIKKNITINKTYKCKSGNNLSYRSVKPQHIVVHYTAGPSGPGNAKNNCLYFNGGNRSASADFFIDDSGIYQYNPNLDKYYTWHCGDGHGAYGITNAASIGIEVCQQGDRPYTENEIPYLTWLVQKLMSKYDIPRSKVVRHYDASRKLCPYYYAKRPSKWQILWRRITMARVVSFKVTKIRYLYPSTHKVKKDRIMKIPKGATVEYLHEKDGEWRKVKYKGKTGWVYRRTLVGSALKAIYG